MSDSGEWNAELLQHVRKAICVDGYCFPGSDRGTSARLSALLKAEGYDVSLAGVGSGNAEDVIYFRTQWTPAELDEIARKAE